MSRKMLGIAVASFGLATALYILFGLRYSSTSSAGKRIVSKVPAAFIGDPVIFFWAAFILLVSIAAAIGVARRSPRLLWTTSILLIGLTLLEAFYIGIFVLPLTILNIILAVKTGRASGASGSE